MKKIAGIAAALLLALTLWGCSAGKPPMQNAVYYDVFDTVTTVLSAGDGADFQRQAAEIHEDLLELHRLFDIYHDYDGLVNLKTVNDQAAGHPVRIPAPLFELLTDCRRYYDATGGRVNAAMGSALSLWHDARETGILPDPAALEEAMRHTDFDAVILDEASQTVFFEDPALRLDVGAIAKGWAGQRIAEALPEGILLSIGGNVLATGPKRSDGTPWTVGVQDPDGPADSYIRTVKLQKGALVTSGDYQRYMEVSGVRYSHIIDPDTGYPGRLWRSVTVFHPDSGTADALSTALYLLPRQEGGALAAQLGAEALWVAPDGSVSATAGFPAA